MFASLVWLTVPIGRICFRITKNSTYAGMRSLLRLRNIIVYAMAGNEFELDDE